MSLEKLDKFLMSEDAPDNCMMLPDLGDLTPAEFADQLKPARKVE